MTTTPLAPKKVESDEIRKIPRPFLLRRLHSLTGLWLVIYLFEHLLVNSQAALYFKDEGHAFIAMVNRLESLPYLKAIELIFIGVPFFVHGIWGISYLKSGKFNSVRMDEKHPALPQYPRNRAFTWQRVTSVILVFGVIFHVLQMRFIHYPNRFFNNDHENFMVLLNKDPSLLEATSNLNVKLYDQKAIDERIAKLKQDEITLLKEPSNYPLKNQIQNERHWVESAKKKPLKEGKVLAEAPSGGAAFFLILRETFKNPMMVLLYSMFVVAACFHSFNGLWTFLITWGVTLTRRSQKTARFLTNILMALTLFFGLVAIWGVYWTLQFQG